MDESDKASRSAEITEIAATATEQTITTTTTTTTGATTTATVTGPPTATASETQTSPSAPAPALASTPTPSTSPTPIPSTSSTTSIQIITETFENSASASSLTASISESTTTLVSKISTETTIEVTAEMLAELAKEVAVEQAKELANDLGAVIANEVENVVATDLAALRSQPELFAINTVQNNNDATNEASNNNDNNDNDNDNNLVIKFNTADTTESTEIPTKHNKIEPAALQISQETDNEKLQATDNTNNNIDKERQTNDVNHSTSNTVAEESIKVQKLDEHILNEIMKSEPGEEAVKFFHIEKDDVGASGVTGNKPVVAGKKQMEDKPLNSLEAVPSTSRNSTNTNQSVALQIECESTPSPSVRSIGSLVCRICHNSEQPELLVSPCLCKGSLTYVHVHCLERWISLSRNTMCELCQFQYNTQQTLRYTCLQSLRMWYSRAMSRTALQEDCQMFSLLTLVAFGIVGTLLVGLQYYIIQGRMWGVSRLWTKGWLVFFLLTTLIVYFINIYMIVRSQLAPWYRWWQSARDIQLILENRKPFRVERKYHAQTHPEAVESVVQTNTSQPALSPPAPPSTPQVQVTEANVVQPSAPSLIQYGCVPPGMGPLSNLLDRYCSAPQPGNPQQPPQ